MTDDRELVKKCAFDARALLNDMQGNGHIDELKLLKATQLFSTLAETGLPMICVETRHMRAVLQAQINKTDRSRHRGG